MCAILISKALRYTARVNEGSLTPTRLFKSGMSHTCFKFIPAAAPHHRTLVAVLTARPAYSRRLSWHRRLVTFRRGLPMSEDGHPSWHGYD